MTDSNRKEASDAADAGRRASDKGHIELKNTPLNKNQDVQMEVEQVNNPYRNLRTVQKRLGDNRDSVDTNAFNGRQGKADELKLRQHNDYQNQTILDSLQSRGGSKGNLQGSVLDINASASDAGCLSPGGSMKNLESDRVDSPTKKKLVPVGQDPEEKKQFEQMRIGYLQSQSFLSMLCCSKALRCLNLDRDRDLEIVMFKRSYKPSDQIQALVNLGCNINSVKKVTMSLYMMIEIKDPNQLDAILSKYTVCQRIYQTVHDLRATNPSKKDI